ncbi:5-carboxymethyl-2-hydroxymuconate Delta-isomerase [Shewanella sp. Isolate11]|uniref:5-carboxymethyl-2-hydroxymuconate Delta-isomerase n=1 Tax=Shewanella sp. Isolate11 TaxID=2908530 RepID=UPI001EFC3A4C|nr:5-carboxymethyl-2-hydroxymuconate Delta-isomerase [Shewanella sp. Isolate11]MCG9697062.1 5-carboxymethyl-2-hydroxymuconate Delta-isomerase [Shewanella sp. Isolate11]
MPHCIIEYSAALTDKLDVSDLVQAVHQGAIACGLFEPSAVKTRSYPSQHNQVGLLTDGSFVHITFKIMPGRSEEQKQLLTQTVYQHLNELAENVNSITMEVLDIAKSSYFKRLN